MSTYYMHILSCLDIPECALGRDDCHVNATCSETPGSFECTCNQGFSGDGRDCQGNFFVAVFCLCVKEINIHFFKLRYSDQNQHKIIIISNIYRCVVKCSSTFFENINKCILTKTLGYIIPSKLFS